MATTADIHSNTNITNIDPALREEPEDQIVVAVTKPIAAGSTSTAGTKRKARTSAASTSAAGAAGTRGSRRAAASTASANASTTSGPASGPADHEPARGEEENLIGYWGKGKRARRESPTKRATASASSSAQAATAAAGANRFYPGGATESWAGPSTGGAQSDKQDLPATLSAGEAAASDRPLFPYPFGLTPFRYPCLTPDHPPPPPGDPSDPKFRPFDPHANVSTAKSPSSSPSKSPTKPLTSTEPPATSGTAVAIDNVINAGVGTDMGMGMPPLDPTLEDTAAYESISALLSASQYGTEGFADLGSGSGLPGNDGTSQ